MSIAKQNLTTEIEQVFKKMFKEDKDNFSDLGKGLSDAIDNYMKMAVVIAGIPIETDDKQGNGTTSSPGSIK
jgi:hypothetical protein